jgi:hypothetical protein
MASYRRQIAQYAAFNWQEKRGADEGDIFIKINVV